jgi:hypothetical protein
MKKLSLKKVFLFGLLSIFGACVLLVAFIAAGNRNLPTASQSLERLSEKQKAYLLEATHLRRTLGEQIWTGWGEADIPFIVYNEAYAFLVGSPDPADGWVKMPDRVQRGTTWEVVLDDSFEGEIYYRQRLVSPNVTPEAFAVLVGERWVAALPTREYMEISFYEGFRSEVPTFLQPIFPYRFVYGLIMGSVDTYIESLNHEAFHAFEGMTNLKRFTEAEEVMRIEQSYPWENADLEASWKEEVGLLLSALEAETDAEALDLAQQFWRHREARRLEFNLTREQSLFEWQREWLEGLAKYSELALARLAGSTPSYTPILEIQADPDFDAYTRQEMFWNQQLKEAASSSVSQGESKFYYSGLVQAAVLDRLFPTWKERILITDLALEDLLRELTPIQP